MFLETYCATLQGKRNYQEDRYLLQEPLFVIADGMGGHPAGDKAAETVINAFKNFDSKTGDIPAAMQNALTKATQECRSHGDKRGSTAIAVYIEDGWHTHIAHVGDSRVYHIRHTATQITKDHEGPFGGLTNWIGSPYMRVAHIETALQPDDILVIVTDGVFGGIEHPFNHHFTIENTVQNALNNKEDPALELCRVGVQKMGARADNATAIVIKITED